MAEATLELLPRLPIAAPRGGLLRRPICPGREPPILAVKRPARTYKTRIQTGKFTMEKAQAFYRPGRPDRRRPQVSGMAVCENRQVAMFGTRLERAGSPCNRQPPGGAVRCPALLADQQGVQQQGQDGLLPVQS